MKKIRFLISALAALLGTTFSASAATIGDAAAPLKIAEWVKGKSVDLADLKGKQVVVVEFWATWCGPCRASIPHLTEMQKKFKDVVFIGVSDEDSDTIKPFVKKMAEKMDYTVAADEDRKTSAGYMEAFKIDGIPHAFIVDKEGRIVWHGHPMAGLEATLTEITTGKFSLEKSKKRADAQKQVEEFEAAASNNPDDPKLEKMGKDLEALDAEIGGIEPGQKFSAAEVLKNVRFQSLLRDYQLALMADKGGTNLTNIEKKLEENAPKGFELAEFKKSMAERKLLNDYMTAAQKGDTNTLPALTKQVGDLKAKDSRTLLQIAWMILDEAKLKVHDYDLASKLAKSAVDETESKDPGPLYVYARALYENGKVDDAIASLKKAIAAAGENEEARKELESTLKKYQEKLAQK
jgi:thiol-disulfide isomerase/thioredoxin